MLVAPSVFPTYFTQGDTAATKATSKATTTTLNATNPTLTSNNTSATSPKAHFASKGAHSSPTPSSAPTASNVEHAQPTARKVDSNTAPVPVAATAPRTTSSSYATAHTTPPNAPSTPKGALLSAAVSKPVMSSNAPTSSYAGHAYPTARKHGAYNASWRTPRYQRRTLAYRTQGFNKFNNVNQRMGNIEQRFTKRIQCLESERAEQQTTIRLLTEELERLIAAMYSNPGAPIPLPIYDPIQAPPPPGALHAPLPLRSERLSFQLEPQGDAPVPRIMCFLAPPPPSTTPPPLPPTEYPMFQEPQTCYPPMGPHCYPSPVAHHASYTQPCSSPPAPANLHYCRPQETSNAHPYYPSPPATPQDAQYPHVQYPHASGYNSYPPSQAVDESGSSAMHNRPGNGYQGVEVMAC